MTDLLAEIRARDTAKGHSGGGVTMTQPEADRRTLLRLLDATREELADALGKLDRLAIRTIAAEERLQDDIDIQAENAELRRQLADAPTAEAAIAKLRAWVPDYAVGASHVAMPVATARKLLDAIDEDDADRKASLLAILTDLDRCTHGRHEGDTCADCGGPSQGNPHLPPGTVIGYDIRAEPIVMAGRANKHDPQGWCSHD